MVTKYWSRVDECYVSSQEAEDRGMHGVERHHFVTKADLVRGGGLPLAYLEHINSKFFIEFKDVTYQVVNPSKSHIHMCELESWAGEVTVVENNNEKGVIDVNTGDMIIPFDKNHYDIYPISSNFFVVVAPDIDHKKIVDRKKQSLDRVIGTYELREDQLFRRLYSKDDHTYRTSGRHSIESLQKRSAVVEIRPKFIQSIKASRVYGYDKSMLTQILRCAYKDVDDQFKSPMGDYSPNTFRQYVKILRDAGLGFNDIYNMFEDGFKSKVKKNKPVM